MTWNSARNAFMAAALLAVPCYGAAQLPPAADLIAAYHRALGGEAALAKYDAMHTSGSVDFPMAGISAGIEVYRARPNRMLVVSNLADVGEIRSGYDGRTGWAIDPMHGARLLEGAELSLLLEQVPFEKDLRRMQDLKSAETLERVQLGGEECYRVKLVWQSGRESVECYSVSTGLLTARTETQNSEAGSVEVLTVFQDYADFGGIRLPRTTVVNAGSMQQLLRLDRVDFVPADPHRFDLPREIIALLEKATPREE